MLQSRHRLPFMFALLMCLAARSWAQPYVYRLVDAAAGDQQGHVLSGTITFDQICGTHCTADNVVDFQVSVRGEKGFELDFNPAIPDVVLGDNSDSWAFVEVTPTRITLDRTPRPAQPLEGQLQLGDMEFGPVLQWRLWIDSDGPRNTYLGMIPTIPYSEGVAWYVDHSGALPKTVIAEVPEPNTLTLLGVLGLALAVSRRAAALS